jgi:hypothetical protein
MARSNASPPWIPGRPTAQSTPLVRIPESPPPQDTSKTKYRPTSLRTSPTSFRIVDVGEDSIGGGPLFGSLPLVLPSASPESHPSNLLCDDEVIGLGQGAGPLARITNIRSFLSTRVCFTNYCYMFCYFWNYCISFAIVGIETTTKSWRQTVEPPVGMGSLRCWESRRLISLEMFGHVLFYLFVYSVSELRWLGGLRRFGHVLLEHSPQAENVESQ